MLRRELRLHNEYLLDLDHRFRILARNIFLRCYSEGLKTDLIIKDEQDRKPIRTVFVTYLNSQISCYAGHDRFDDWYDKVFKADYHLMLQQIGHGDNLESIASYIAKSVSPQEVQQSLSARELRSTILEGTVVCRPLVVGPPSFSELLQQAMERSGSSMKFPLDYAPETLQHFLQSAVNAPALLDADNHRDDSAEGSSEMISNEGIAHYQESRFSWYHIRYCVGSWAALLLSAIALRDGDVKIPVEALTEHLWGGVEEKMRLDRPEWAFPSPFFRVLPIVAVEPHDGETVDRRSHEPQNAVQILVLPFL